MGLKLRHIGVHPPGELGKIGLVNRGVVHIPPGQLLGQDVEEDFSSSIRCAWASEWESS